MEYYNIQSQSYLKAISLPTKKYKIKVEFLGVYENVIDEVSQDLSADNQGRINVNYQQLVRRSCSFTLLNVNLKYIPNPSSLVWVDRKFKLWIGLETDNDIYWFSQGVYVITEASNTGTDVTIQASDKGSILNGDVLLGMTETQYIIETGAKIEDLIKDTLMLDRGNNIPLDTQEPIINTEIGNLITQAEISIDENSYIGEVFTNIATNYGADIYYNTDGRLIIEKLADEDRIDGYKYMGHLWEFDELTSDNNRNVNYDLKGINAVTVYTNSNNFKNVSYTAYNNNPLSPLRVDMIGIRRKESQEISYVDVEVEGMTERCKDYANYILYRESMISMNLSFSCPVIPHLDVNRTIGVTDTELGFKHETFVIQSLDIPLGAGDMTVTATNIQWLPIDTDIEKGV